MNGKDFRNSYKVEQPKRSEQQRFTSKDNLREKSKQQRKQRVKKIRLTLASITLAGLVGLGALGYKGVQNYQYQNSPITLAGALELGNTTEELGISQETAKQIEDLKLKLKYTNPDELLDEQITVLASQVESLQFDVIKSKISDKLEIKQEEIKLHPSDPKNDTSAYIYDEKNEKLYSAPQVFQKTGLADNIGNLINELGSIQYIADGNSKESNKDIYKDLISAVNNIDQFAGAEISVNDGKITVNYTKIKELGAVNQGREIGE